MSKSKMINIGCGEIRHPDWINLDVSSSVQSVLQVDVNNGLPFPSDSIASCYSSHLLEHLDKEAGRKFVAECLRVLKSGGVLRLAVPDLEEISKEYLRLLGEITNGNLAKESDYDWIMLEMYDQTIRNCPGGEMAVFLAKLHESDRAYVKSRVGAEAENFWAKQEVSKQPLKSMMIKLKSRSVLKSIHMEFVGWIVCMLAGKSARKNFLSGIFRGGGEIHQWMYDRYSLNRLLEQAGFVDIRICAATESRISQFELYSLDTLNGVSRKPDSIYVEASKL